MDGAEEDPYAADGTIVPYGGHGTFVAGILRCVAPKASVFVERAFDIAGADFETRLASSLADALDARPDIMVFTFTASTHRDSSLHTFDDFYERRLRHRKGLVVLAPAGNDAWSQPDVAGRPPGRDRRRRPGRELARPGALHQLRPVGRCLRAGRKPRQRLPRGNLRVQRAAERRGNRQFHGMAMWSGTSFSTPLVAGLIAARMSQTGQNAQQAWDSLQRFAVSQSIPGVGPVLYPGQADGEPGH